MYGLRNRRLYCELLEDRRLLASAGSLDELDDVGIVSGDPPFIAAQVRGMVWLDANNNGIREDHEIGLGGVVVYSDLNGNGVLDNGEPRTESIFDPRDVVPNDTGLYELDNLRPGLHLIRQIVPEGYHQTYPNSAFAEFAPPFPIPVPPDAHLVLLHEGQHVSGFEFGNHPFQPGAVTGVKWEDLDGDGQRDNNEPGLGGVLIYADLNRDGVFQSNEPHAETSHDNPETDFDEGGRYEIGGLRPGDYLIREVVPDGFRQTFPNPDGPVPGDPDDIIGGPIDPEFATVHPDAIHVNLAAGEVFTATVSITVHPLPFREIYINAVADSSDVLFENLSGLQINGGGGDTSHFEVQIIGDGEPHQFHILLVNADPFLSPAVVITYGAVAVSINDPPPSGGAHRVHVARSQVVDGIDFGNQRLRPGMIHGIKWHDLNGNGSRENNEPGLAGVVIYSDLNRNGVLDNDEPRTRTIEDDPDTDFNEEGMFWLQLRPGRHVIREVVPDGFVQTFPATMLPPPGSVVDPLLPPWPGGEYELLVEPGKVIDGVDFGNQEFAAAAVEGLKWQDLDGDGVRDPNELGLGNVVIYSDLNYNGILDEGEPRTTTIDDPREIFPNDTGKYRLEGLRPGSHVIREVVPAGYRQTYPGEVVIAGEDPTTAIFPPIGGAHFVYLASGQTLGDLDFGNQPTESGLIAGYKWVDLNGDRQRSNDEPGLAGVTIYSDLNFNGVLDPDEPRAVTQEDDPSTPANELGRYRLRLEPGTHNIREVVPHGYIQTFPVSLSLAPFPFDGDGWHTVVVEPGSVNDDVHFGNQPVEPGAVRGIKWNDLDGDGQRDDNEPGLAGVVIYADANHNRLLDEGELHTTTLEDDPNTERNELGTYLLGGLRPAVHIIREVIPDGYAPTFPPSPAADPVGPFDFYGYHVVAISAPGQVVEGINFGNQQIPPSVVAGRKWNDLDGDRQRDDNEPGLAGVVVYSDRNFNGRFDPDEPHIRTMEDDPNTERDETGLYMLFGLRPGQHLIREVVPDGFVQTYPVSDAASPLEEPAGHYVNLEIGEIVDGLNFGNHQVEPAGVSGRKWVDTNANGVWDNGEEGLGGVTIYSDLNHNGAFDEGEPQTETLHEDPFTDFDEAGLYVLDGLRPGFHFIREIVPLGSIQTYPLSPLAVIGADAHAVNLDPGEHVDGLDFGNVPVPDNSVTPLAGDFNHDGAVNDLDQQMWRHTYGSRTNLMADANHDGVVGLADFIVWRNNEGAQAASLATVASTPQPAVVASVAAAETSVEASVAATVEEPVATTAAARVVPSAQTRRATSASGAEESASDAPRDDSGSSIATELLTLPLGRLADSDADRDATFGGLSSGEVETDDAAWLVGDGVDEAALATVWADWE